jgi:hypothetical protein
MESADVPVTTDKAAPRRVDNYVLKYDGSVLVSEISNRRDISAFANPLRRFNGDDQWALMLAPLPPGQSYPDVVEAGDWFTDYIQAAGSGPDAITVEIRKPGGRQWGADWVRYVVGHPHNDDAPSISRLRCPAALRWSVAMRFSTPTRLPNCSTPTTSPATYHRSTLCGRSRATPPTAQSSTCAMEFRVGSNNAG